MVTRRRSVPSKTPPTHNPGSTNSRNSRLDVPSAIGPQKAAESVQLLSRAETLSRMTFELNIHKVGRQADQLVREVQALVVLTSQDKEFREKYERRMQEIWREILAVKARESEVQGAHEGDFHKCQAAIAELKKEVGDEVRSLKDLAEHICGQMDQLLEGQDFSDVQVCGSVPPSKTRTNAASSSKRWTVDTSQQSGLDKLTQTACKRRIKEALCSTSRWNRDYKTTRLHDAVFTANYLRQQSKRDPAMAVFIQKGVQKRIRRRLPRTRHRPDSLDEFCRDVTWEDVIKTVEDVLVKGESHTMRALSRE